MKKAILLTLILQWIIVSSTFAMNGDDKTVSRTVKTGRFTSVTINADVKVELFNSTDENIHMEGNELFIRDISIRVEGDKLVIDAATNKNYKKKGVIHIPAGALRYMEINSPAVVQSAETLEIPQLDVLINGVCQLNIANRGKLKLNGSRYYSVDYVMRDARFPFIILDQQENQ